VRDQNGDLVVDARNQGADMTITTTSLTKAAGMAAATAGAIFIAVQIKHRPRTAF
jgi:hypothetical protein